ncbi:MAG: TIGR01459 family HAD-type hydrolase [Rhodospirillales bacterium]|nr:TIGR01459 family HAD-type hydrolase [Rhodospirillales bacterium]
MSSYKILNGLQDVVDQYDVFLLDVWGVLHDGVAPFPGTIDALKRLQDAGKTVCLLSNSPARSADLRFNLSSQFAIEADHYNQILSSGEAAFLALQHETGTYKAYANSDFFFSQMKNLPLHEASSVERADFVINAYHAGHDFPIPVQEELKIAAAAGIPMICVNPDMVVRVGNSTTLCPGTLAALYEEWGGTVTYYGKPHKPFYEQAWELLGRLDKNRMVAVGDALHTDIQGANNFGINSLFNLSGIHLDEVSCSKTGELAEGKLLDLIDGQPHKPTAILNGFSW